ncbi:MAG: hypothetical protein ACKO8U_09090 [Pirellula sp.]
MPAQQQDITLKFVTLPKNESKSDATVYNLKYSSTNFFITCSTKVLAGEDPGEIFGFQIEDAQFNPPVAIDYYTPVWSPSPSPTTTNFTGKIQLVTRPGGTPRIRVTILTKKATVAQFDADETTSEVATKSPSRSKAKVNKKA